MRKQQSTGRSTSAMATVALIQAPKRLFTAILIGKAVVIAATMMIVEAMMTTDTFHSLARDVCC